QLSRSAYRDYSAPELEVETERPFAVRDGDRLLVGTIDRLVTMRRNDRIVAADILDFKTDELAADDEFALHAKAVYYRPQLQAYRSAVSIMLSIPGKAVTARLLFVSQGKIVSVE
ncbi:MAG TPA: PD-(D/E)XK nuclease family protein, partial [Pirellulaceae bacterium]